MTILLLVNLPCGRSSYFLTLSYAFTAVGGAITFFDRAANALFCHFSARDWAASATPVLL